MANIKFILRSASDRRPQTIYVSFRFGRNDKLMYGLPLKCEYIYWDKERERVKSSMYCLYSDEVNEALESIEAQLKSFIVECAKNGTLLTKTRMKEFLDTKMGKNHKADSFHKFFELYIAECDKRMNGRRGGQTVTYKTKREYARTHEYIKMYEVKRRVWLDFGDIDQTFLTDFVGFLQELNLSTNTIAHKIISLKALMHAAESRGLTTNERWKDYKIATEDTDAVALSEDELQKIYEHDMSYDPRLERIKDLFLLECWTGLRFSDISALRKENIQGNFIIIRQQKTNNIVTIPIHPVFREIWSKYDGIPIHISNQRFNDQIKKICKAVGIDEPILKSITKGGKKTVTQYQKWRLISSHTGRRSFATNLYKSGFPSISIMQITGHKSEAAFLKYIKVTKDEHAKLLAAHWQKQIEANEINLLALGIKKNEHLYWCEDPRVFVTVCSEHEVIYNGMVVSLSEITKKLKGTNTDIVSTPYWTYNGVPLSEIFRKNE